MIRIMLPLLFLINSLVFSQDSVRLKKVPSKIVFKTHMIRTQEVVDIEKAANRKAFKENAEVFYVSPRDRKKFIDSHKQFDLTVEDTPGEILYFINDKEYLTYYMPFNEYFGYNFDRVDKDSLIGNRIQLQDLSSSPLKIRWFNESDYEVVKTDKLDRKTIHGFDCYKVIIKYKKRPFKWVLYVTEDFKLNYHPIFKHKSLLKEFFPLELNYRHLVYKEGYQYSYEVLEISN